MTSGDLLRVGDEGEQQVFGLLAFSEKGERCEALLGWDTPEPIALSAFDDDLFEDAPLSHWIASQAEIKALPI